MDVLKASGQVFQFADRHGQKINDMLNDPNFGQSASDPVMLNFQVTMMGTMWQLAADLSKDLTDPLKSIVNK